MQSSGRIAADFKPCHGGTTTRRPQDRPTDPGVNPLGENMKKTAATFILLAGLGGGCVSPSGTTGNSKAFNAAYRNADVKGLSGPIGEPVAKVGAKVPAKTADSGIVQAGGMMPANGESMIQQTAGFGRIGGGSAGGCSSCGDSGDAGHGGLFSKHSWGHNRGCNSGYCGNGGGGYGGPPLPNGGPFGMVGGMGMGGMGMGGMGMGPMYANQRTAVKFVAPQGMQISWWANGSYAEPGLSTPSAYNFAQGGVYRLRVRGIPNRPGKVYYPTLDVWGANPKTVTFLSHNTVPVGFTDEDFDQVNSGNMVVKVIYLPDPAFQELSTVAGAEELVSTKLQPGEDPLAEAQRRGTILAVIRLGNIDLENPNSPSMTTPPPGAPVPPAGPMGAPMPGGPMGLPAPTPPAKPSTPAPSTPVTSGFPQAMPGTATVNIPLVPTAVSAPKK